MFLQICFYGYILVTITVVLHARGTTNWMRFLLWLHKTAPDKPGSNNANTLILIATTLVLLFLHLIEILLWAGAYYVIPEVEIIMSWIDAIYFSMVTYTTLGYDDIILSGDTRLLTGIPLTAIPAKFLSPCAARPTEQ